MLATAPKQERVLLFGVELPESRHFAASMNELARLAQTAGAHVAARSSQKRSQYDSRFLLGSGKLADLQSIIKAKHIDTLIVNNRLSPRQHNNLESALNLKVLDRMQLILDIFALHARSYEGKLQVQLAQLDYLLPRLTGKGAFLSRQAGGIGSRGPGESQLELNRRLIRSQMTTIKRELRKISQNRQLLREERLGADTFKIGLVGYTNAGKSTIMNLLTRGDEYVADSLFATLDSSTKQLYLQGQFQATLTDTVGFIQDLPTELIAAFKSTLEESRHVNMLLHVIDASDPQHERQESLVLKLLEELDMMSIPRLTVYNKIDLAEHFSPTLFPYIQLSAREQKSKKKLQQQLIAEIKKQFTVFDLNLSADRHGKLYELGKYALLNYGSADSSGSQTVRAYIAPENKWRLEDFYD
ncbi:GTPase HflX [Streptococcus pantholopis]|uniref:GTPase HflX n=1 Tax=Streptococcus pantholopis TaxID=1811193 RepID=A0A172Q803_9STRE|nr:GTPase HflX [Streptococcus pantholopis]AND79594.1 GTPase HflX [Streptococcus pantholopis]